jgi:hypothetical protein
MNFLTKLILRHISLVIYSSDQCTVSELSTNTYVLQKSRQSLVQYHSYRTTLFRLPSRPSSVLTPEKDCPVRLPSVPPLRSSPANPGQGPSIFIIPGERVVQLMNVPRHWSADPYLMFGTPLLIYRDPPSANWRKGPLEVTGSPHRRTKNGGGILSRNRP